MKDSTQPMDISSVLRWRGFPSHVLNDFSSSNIFSVSITEINYLNKKVDYYNLTFDSRYQLPNECSYYIGLNYTGAKIGVRY